MKKLLTIFSVVFTICCVMSGHKAQAADNEIIITVPEVSQYAKVINKRAHLYQGPSSKNKTLKIFTAGVDIYGYTLKDFGLENDPDMAADVSAVTLDSDEIYPVVNNKDRWVSLGFEGLTPWIQSKYCKLASFSALRKSTPAFDTIEPNYIQVMEGKGKFKDVYLISRESINYDPQVFIAKKVGDIFYAVCIYISLDNGYDRDNDKPRKIAANEFSYARNPEYSLVLDVTCGSDYKFDNEENAFIDFSKLSDSQFEDFLKMFASIYNSNYVYVFFNAGGKLNEWLFDISKVKVPTTKLEIKF